MMAAQAILIFDLNDPDARYEHKLAMAGPALMHVVQEMDEYLRQIVKYGDDEAKATVADSLRTHMRSMLMDESIDIDAG